MKLGTFLAAQAVSRPDRAALVCGDQSITFRELHEASDRAATGLRDAGVKIGDRVAMLLPNRCEFVLLFMAIVKCGGIALPLNHRLSPISPLRPRQNRCRPSPVGGLAGRSWHRPQRCPSATSTKVSEST